MFEGGVQNVRSSLQDDYVMSGSFCHGHVVIHVGYMFEYIFTNEINIHNSLECGVDVFFAVYANIFQGNAGFVTRFFIMERKQYMRMVP